LTGAACLIYIRGVPDAAVIMVSLEKANRKGAKAQSLAKTMHCMEATVLHVGEPIVCEFLCVTRRLCAFAVMNCGFLD
jgi:hypothetical protein